MRASTRSAAPSYAPGGVEVIEHLYRGTYYASCGGLREHGLPTAGPAGFGWLVSATNHLADRPRSVHGISMRRLAGYFLVAMLFASWVGLDGVSSVFAAPMKCAGDSANCIHESNTPDKSCASMEVCVSGCGPTVFAETSFVNLRIGQTIASFFAQSHYRHRISQPDPFPPRLS